MDKFPVSWFSLHWRSVVTFTTCLLFYLKLIIWNWGLVYPMPAGTCYVAHASSSKFPCLCSAGIIQQAPFPSLKTPASLYPLALCVQYNAISLTFENWCPAEFCSSIMCWGKQIWNNIHFVLLKLPVSTTPFSENFPSGFPQPHSTQWLFNWNSFY